MPNIKITRGFQVIICNELNCKHKTTCANYSSAGDYKTDQGIKPILILDNNLDVSCETKNLTDISNHKTGAVLWTTLINKPNNIMDNLIIPNPTKYEITYTDSKNKTTSRKIVVIEQEKDSVTAYCYHPHGVRTFKKKQISNITSVN
jgi:hypothetical protein